MFTWLLNLCLYKLNRVLALSVGNKSGNQLQFAVVLSSIGLYIHSVPVSYTKQIEFHKIKKKHALSYEFNVSAIYASVVSNSKRFQVRYSIKFYSSILQFLDKLFLKNTFTNWIFQKLTNLGIKSSSFNIQYFRINLFHFIAKFQRVKQI